MAQLCYRIIDTASGRRLDTFTINSAAQRGFNLCVQYQQRYRRLCWCAEVSSRPSRLVFSSTLYALLRGIYRNRYASVGGTMVIWI